MKQLIKKLSEIQKAFKVPKNYQNDFGGYPYRKCEDILEKFKQYIDDETTLYLSNKVELKGNHRYVITTATFYHRGESLSLTAEAREEEEKKKNSAPQLTGSAATYSAKKVLGNLFLLDDSKDPDTEESTKEIFETRTNNNKNNDNQPKQNNKTQNNKKEDWQTTKLRELLSSKTKHFKDKVQVNIICQALNVKDLSVLAGYDNKKKKEVINYLKKNFK